MDEVKVVIDTNLLLDEPEIIEKYNTVILSHVIRELEKHKISKSDELAYNARRATRYIEANIEKVSFDTKDYYATFDEYVDTDYVDNKIIQACIDNKYSLITKDLLLKHKAKALNITVINFEQEDYSEYTGYREIEIVDEELASIYENPRVNTYNILTNEYLIATHPFGHSSVVFKWDGEQYVDIPERTLHSVMLGKFKPYDLYQRCAIDSAFTNQITMIRGKAGSGKTQIALNYGISELEKGKIHKIIMFTGNIPVAGVNGIGYLPGTREEKLVESGIGNILSSKFGDRNEIYGMIQTGRLELLPMSDIRGYDTGDRALVILTEAQNTSKDLMKLALQRIGEGSKVIIDGDDKAQVDKQMFAGLRNGMKAVSNAFKGEDIYGEVTLKEIRRSKIAKLADRL